MPYTNRNEEGRFTYADELEALKGEIQHGLEPNPAPSNGRLPLDALTTVEEVFQPRDRIGMMDEDDWFIDDLKQAVERGSTPDLDPVVVWWSGKRWIVIDGHHRLAAYQRAARDVETIPVEPFEGSLDDVRLEAVRLNQKNKLVMRQSERLEAAWRLVCTSDLSKKRIAESCGISARTVATMRSRGKEVIAAKPGQWSWRYLAGERWDRVKSPGFLAADNDNDFDPDAAVRKRAEGYARKLAKNFGRKPMEDPEGFALALALLNESLPERLMASEQWSEYVIDADVEEDFAADF